MYIVNVLYLAKRFLAEMDFQKVSVDFIILAYFWLPILIFICLAYSDVLDLSVLPPKTLERIQSQIK